VIKFSTAYLTQENGSQRIEGHWPVPDKARDKTSDWPLHLVAVRQVSEKYVVLALAVITI
jgi:hypothetical protein